jgi:hypothetical protein
MANTFEIDIPRKDHPLVVIVQPRDNESAANVFDLYYCEQLCGSIFKNEHSIWIYEPHAHAALILDAGEIQHLGAAIAEQSYNQ